MDFVYDVLKASLKKKMWVKRNEERSVCRSFGSLIATAYCHIRSYTPMVVCCITAVFFVIPFPYVSLCEKKRYIKESYKELFLYIILIIILSNMLLRRKAFKYPTSTFGDNYDGATSHIECTFAHESLIVVETDDVTRRVSVKILRLPTPPTLQPISVSLPFNTEHSSIIRRRTAKRRRPSPETRRHVEHRLQMLHRNQLHTNTNNSAASSPVLKQHSQSTFSSDQTSQSHSDNSAWQMVASLLAVIIPFSWVPKARDKSTR